MSIVTLEELVAAYHRAKVDLYYGSESRLVDLLEYEESLESKLHQLLARINAADEEWVRDPLFVGTYTLAPKHVEPPKKAGGGDFQWSDPARAWQARVANAGTDKATAEFRVMSMCSIDMHVLSTLWMQTAGATMEKSLGVEAMGSRLRRTRSGDVNTRAPGTFEHYYRPYGQWRDRGLAAMTNALESGDDVVAITADITSFYHRLNPEFLLQAQFTKDVLGIRLTPLEHKINRLFVRSLWAWSEHVAAEGHWNAHGMPVGLPASAVVANLALIELDRMVLRELQPLYYGRYVDDVILVLKTNPTFTSQRNVWDWIIARSHGSLAARIDSSTNETTYCFVRDYHHSSRIEFGNGKNKIFHLTGESGLSVVGSIRKAIDERASEWRSFTPVSENPAAVGRDLAIATCVTGEDATTLRDADQISTRRSAFAIKLRDFEAYARDLDRDSWASQRTAFLDAVCSHVIALPTFFDLARYLPRVVRLAAACDEFTALTRLFESVTRLYDTVHTSCVGKVKAYSVPDSAQHTIWTRWADQLIRSCVEGLASGLASQPSAATISKLLYPLRQLPAAALPGTQRLQKLHKGLFNRDLAYLAYRFTLLNPEIAPQDGLPPTLDLPDPIDLPIEDEVRDGLDTLVASLRASRISPPLHLPRDVVGSDIPGLRFATRPPNVWELFLALRGQESEEFGFASPGTIQKILGAVRGYTPSQNLPRIVHDEPAEIPTLTIAGGPNEGKVRFALAMIETSVESVKRAALGHPDLARKRYESFKHIFNEALSRPSRADYVILPELALPSRWFVPFANKLRQSGANLIAGIEYLSAGRTAVHNEVWAALRSGGGGDLGYLVYPQDKQRPAPSEELMLANLDRLRLQPRVEWKAAHPPAIAHGEFRFAMLVCSELTNIQYRSALRGHVDALVVPEWNKDLHTFDALVESAALDIHAYIIQVNCRPYGDSRIRSPHKDEWNRDVLRVRGGAHDYVVIGEVDYYSLRQHHTLHRKPEGKFKPLPDGFTVSPTRRRLPRTKEGD